MTGPQQRCRPAPAGRGRGRGGRQIVLLVAAAVLVSVVATGCAGPDETGTVGQRVTSWVQSTGVGSDIGTLEADDRRIRAVVADRVGTAAVRTDCAVLTTDAESANNDLPTPDNAMTQDLSRAYTLDGEAGDNCYAAGASNAALMAKSVGQRNQADALFGAVVARVRRLSGLSVSTTTTTQAGGRGLF